MKNNLLHCVIQNVGFQMALIICLLTFYNVPLFVMICLAIVWSVEAHQMPLLYSPEADNMEIFENPDVRIRLVSKINFAINQTVIDINEDFKKLSADNQVKFLTQNFLRK